jgi:replicative DNA helicase
LNGRRVPTAIKYRDVASGRRDAEPGSVYLEPLVVGDRTALDWFLAEGETDGARLVGLVGDVAAIMILPAGALTFRREWASFIPRGASVYLAHDGDRHGDAGARKAADVVGGRCVRVRPPDGLDWCEWPGDREQFVRLVRDAKARARSRVRTFAEVLDVYGEERSGSELEPIRLGWGTIDAEIRGVSAGQALGIAARTAVGKTWALGSIANTVAVRTDTGILDLTLEMPAVEYAERALAIYEDVSPEEVEAWARQGSLRERAGSFLERMRNRVLIEDQLALADLPAALTDARERLAAPLRLVLVDYLGLIGAEGRSAYEQASAVGKGLKQLAKSEDVAVVVAMQLSRAGGDGSEPVTISMLRDSGVIEESLDFLLGCWRPGKSQTLGPGEAAELRDVMRVALPRRANDGPSLRRTVAAALRGSARLMASDWNLWMERLLSQKLTVAEHRLALAFGRLLLGWKTRTRALGRFALAETAGLDRRTFQRALNGLVDKGLVVVLEPGRRGRGNRATYGLVLETEKGAGERPFAVEKKGAQERSFQGKRRREKGVVQRPFRAQENGALQRPRKGKPKTLKTLPAAKPPGKTIQTQAIEAYLAAGGGLELNGNRDVLVRHVKTLASRGVAERIILAAARELGRERAFPGYMLQRAAALQEAGGPCRWKGLSHAALTVDQLRECDCSKCSEWLAHRVAEARP